MCKSQLSIISWNVEGLKSSLDDEDFMNLVHNFDLAKVIISSYPGTNVLRYQELKV